MSFGTYLDTISYGSRTFELMGYVAFSSKATSGSMEKLSLGWAQSSKMCLAVPIIVLSIRESPIIAEIIDNNN